ncbi:MAG: exodeoxyribonuclease VII small subunit [Chloroflexi bacterium]|jgi:exodeoxyribonuclease VII small subunit|nr:MAG: exodeoxyribonuclease VII small subunit [Chloroflexota bacterium]
MSEQPSLEAMLREIEAIAAQLEQNTLALDESLALYQRGALLVEQSRSILAQASLRIKEIQGQ